MKSTSFALLLLAGCGSITDLAYEVPKEAFGGSAAPHVFGGVRLNAYNFSRPYWLFGELRWLYIADMPFSAIFDVLLLPVSIPVALFSSGE